MLRERKLDEAVPLLRDALAAAPGDAVASFLLAAASAERGDLAEARRVLQLSFAAHPAQPAAHHLLYCRVLYDAGDIDAAEAQGRAAVGGAPELPAARVALAAVLTKRATRLHADAHPLEAIPLYREALALDNRDPDTWNRLGVALTDVAMLAEARDAYREALARQPSYWQVESNLLVHLHYDATIPLVDIFGAHLSWARRHAAGVQRLTLPQPRSSGKRRIGFLSPAFTEGPAATFAWPLFEHLDRARFELVGFNVGGIDACSRALASLANEWHELAGLDDESVARRIVEARIDVLVDLAGHTPGGRPLVLARKPAPRVVTWLDYFDTTGLDAVDILAGDPVSTPEGGAQCFTERVIRVAPARLCYRPPDVAPDVVAPPLVRSGKATFGSFNRYSKITDAVLEWWSAVLHAVPESALVVKNAALTDPACRELLASRLAHRGIGAARLDLRGPSPHAAMLAEYGDIDVALDTFPYNGGLTTCEALWMGVPVVTVLGDAMISRQSAALLGALGRPEWVGRDPAAAVEIARGLVSDAGTLAATRAGLRDRMRGSPLTDAPAFARAFAVALV